MEMDYKRTLLIDERKFTLIMMLSSLLLLFLNHSALLSICGRVNLRTVGPGEEFPIDDSHCHCR